MSQPLVRVVEVRCPRHGPKGGLLLNGVMHPFPLVMEQRRIESAKPLCFECKDMGVRRLCVVLMEPVPQEVY